MKIYGKIANNIKLFSMYLHLKKIMLSKLKLVKYAVKNKTAY